MTIPTSKTIVYLCLSCCFLGHEPHNFRVFCSPFILCSLFSNLSGHIEFKKYISDEICQILWHHFFF